MAQDLISNSRSKCRYKRKHCWWRNPAPPGMYKTLKIMGWTTNLNWLAGFFPSTVSHWNLLRSKHISHQHFPESPKLHLLFFCIHLPSPLLGTIIPKTKVPRCVATVPFTTGLCLSSRCGAVRFHPCRHNATVDGSEIQLTSWGW